MTVDMRLRVMHCLSGTVNYELRYTYYPKVFDGYSDFDWISNVDVIKKTILMEELLSHVDSANKLYWSGETWRLK